MSQHINSADRHYTSSPHATSRLVAPSEALGGGLPKLPIFCEILTAHYSHRKYIIHSKLNRVHLLLPAYARTLLGYS